ncbi:MAG: hypothetical protein ABI678_24910, partial [Kofleriaceae bacterium]
MRLVAMARWFSLALLAGCLHGVPDELPETRPPVPQRVPPAPVDAPVVGPLGPGPLERRYTAETPAERQVIARALERDRKRPLTREEADEDATLLAHVVETYATSDPTARARSLAEVTKLHRAMVVASFVWAAEAELRAAAIYLQPGGASHSAFTWPASPRAG